MPAPTPAAIAERRARFRQLHETGCFLLPNAWDAGSARYLESAGFDAIASTSSGFAWTQATEDSALSLDDTLRHLRELVNATTLPVNADFVDGFGDTAAEVEASVAAAIETGVAGISIEDAYSSPTDRAAHAEPLRSIKESVERIAAARKAIDASGHDVILVGRAENFIVNRADIDDTIARLKAYAAAGADCLYAPGITKPEHITAVVAAVAPKPVNFLAGANSSALSEIARLGVRRVSIGGALARVAWGATMRATALLKEGNFAALADAANGNELNKLMRG
ncbi:Oxaloacetate decarboxylase [Vanrija pseudolonga]|uniref:Oxaloacetate decarboxylase n=1 Tax=Vanrija pseudolonga TaxID=143232 RepID=A0AAF0YGN2_9TREE|nr:Oxaloacetate decarboxylase [Vanrija pseudolonga]